MKEEHLTAIAAVAAAGLAGVAARRLVYSGWKLWRGVDPPANPASRDVTWTDALVFAAATGVLVGVARVAGERLATSGLEAWKGREPVGARRRQLA